MLFKIILFFIIVVLIIRFFSRALLSMFIGNLNNKFTQTQNNSHHNTRNKEGDVIIKTPDKNDKKYGNEGEYVDFEEIKE